MRLFSALIVVTVMLVVSASARPHDTRYIHIIVALCDNIHQGIVPVPASLGNGKDPASNLYWGAAHGVKSFFKRSPDWRMLTSVKNPENGILERCVFTSGDRRAYIVADAYDGERIRDATVMFLESAAGRSGGFVEHGSDKIRFRGDADLVCYVGHDGLMDFSIGKYPEKKRGGIDLIIFACYSKKYFSEAVRSGGGRPLLWTTNLFCPEAYTLEAAIAGWIRNESPESIHMRAARAYAKYQKCGVNAAARLITTGRE